MFPPAIKSSLHTRTFLGVQHVSFKLILLEKFVPHTLISVLMCTTAGVVIFLGDLDCFTSLVIGVLDCETFQQICVEML